jgi:hypothetical protein
VYNTLWNTLTIEMSKKVNQVEILKQKRAIVVSSSLVGFRMVDWCAIGSGIHRLLIVLISLCWAVV